MIDPVLAGLGFLVGALVGLTGIGGGSLLTPLLILVVGIRPTVAVGTDLAFAALTKAVGAWQHTRSGGADLGLVSRLALGSVPGALLGSHVVSALHAVDAAGADAAISRLLGLALLAAAGASLLRLVDPSWAKTRQAQPGRLAAPLLGLGIGVLVGVTSVGAGSVLMAAFALLYALPVTRAVGTDVTQGAVLAAVAALAHGAAGRWRSPCWSACWWAPCRACCWAAGSAGGCPIGPCASVWRPCSPPRERGCCCERLDDREEVGSGDGEWLTWVDGSWLSWKRADRRSWPT